MAATDPVTPESRRFSIRLPRPVWIGVAAVVVVVLYGPLSIWIPYHREQQIVQKINSWGGSVDSRKGGPDWLREVVGDERMEVFDRVRAIYFYDNTFTDGDLPYLNGLTNLEELSLSETQVTNTGLVHLSGLKKLNRLDLDATRVSDAGLAHVSRLPNIQRLSLYGTAVSDSGLVHLNGMTNLEFLDLSETQVSDAGLVYLTSLKNLKVLALYGTPVGNAGVMQLTGLSKLEVLKLRETHVDEDGLEALRKALPDCLITPGGPGGYLFGRDRNPSPLR